MKSKVARLFQKDGNVGEGSVATELDSDTGSSIQSVSKL